MLFDALHLWVSVERARAHERKTKKKSIATLQMVSMLFLNFWISIFLSLHLCYAHFKLAIVFFFSSLCQCDWRIIQFGFWRQFNYAIVFGRLIEIASFDWQRMLWRNSLHHQKISTKKNYPKLCENDGKNTGFIPFISKLLLVNLKKSTKMSEDKDECIEYQI